MKRWTPEQIEALRVYHENDYSDGEIADALGVSEGAVEAKRYRLCLTRRRRTQWTDEALAVLNDPKNRNATNAALAAELGFHESSVLRKRQALGLPHCVLVRWTDEETQFLRDHWHKGARYCAAHIKKDPKHIRTKAHQLGLKRY